MRQFRVLCLFAVTILSGLFAGPDAKAQAAAQAAADGGKRLVFESVVALEGKTIGTSILLEVSSGAAAGSGAASALTGWIQRNDFFPIDSGSMDAEKITFTSGGNQYTINLRTGRINYSGPDGSGNQRVERMIRVHGRVYRLDEEAMEEQRRITLQTDGGEKQYLIGSPSVWKRSGVPIDRFNRLEEVLGKTIDAWLARIGATYYLAVIEEPEGMDLQKKAPKKDKKKDKKKK